MTKSSLLRLSKAYEKGQLTKETYRRRRSELINAVLNASVDDDTITKNNKVQAKGTDASAGENAPTTTPQLSVPEDGGGNKGLLIGGIVAILLVAGGAFMLLSGDGTGSDAATAGDSRESTPAMTKPMSNSQVMISYTEEILSDRNVGDSESSKLYNLWSVSKEDERKAWKAYADAKLIAARNENNEVLTLVMEDLYFDLDVETPDFNDMPPPVPDDMASIVEAAQQRMDTGAEDTMPVSDPVTDVVEDTAAVITATAQEAARQVETADEMTNQPTIPSREEAESELMGALETEIESSETTVAVVVDNTQESDPAVGTETDAAVGETLAAIENAVDAAIEASSSVAAAVDDNVTEVAMPEVPLFEPTSELIEQQQDALVRTGADVVSAINNLDADPELSLETITAFNETLTKANRDERLAATYSADYDAVQKIYELVRNEESRYSFDGLESDDRLRGLQQASRTMRQLIRRVQRNNEQVLAGISADGRMGTESVRSVNPTSFTLQLLGSSSLDGVRQYLTDHGDMKKLFYVELVREGSPWYVVLQGEYPSKEVALIVYESFPAAVREERARAWARSFESIQAVLAQ